MPRNNEIREGKKYSITPSTSGRTKSVITICMVFLTIINPILFVVPSALCGYMFYYREGGHHEA
ncbi:hypothetical protein [uncultured Bacteroides sp.]|uniref:hypothetical protein n=1 Tax=uncultured Bacteroides sp. TaxID=162156 RepID=UPI0025F9A370|nr:hypothetical protein [uncultured Bacteroides sp.]